MTRADDDRAAVEAANAELYAAFEDGDIDRMAATWDDGDVCCVHPGWPPLHGRDRVLRSWTMIMANTAYIQVFLTDVRVRVVGDVAVVSCEESALTSVEDVGAEGTGGRVCSTNVFRRRDGGWRLWLRHASPVLDRGSG